MATTPLPLLYTPTTWGGNDGNWSLFPLSIGTPPQPFLILPSTTSGEIWAPLPLACSGASFSDCASSRGIGLANGTQSQGLNTDASSTWDFIGANYLSEWTELFGDGTEAGYYGEDVIEIPSSGNGGNGEVKVVNSTVAGTSSWNFWMGSFGLGVQGASFETRAGVVNTVLEQMKEQNLTASLAFGLSVGAAYKSSPASLILGGYDRSLFHSPSSSNPSTSAPISTFSANSSAGSRALTASLLSLTITNTTLGIISPLSDSTANLTVAIDSTIPHLWLPENICDTLAGALGLAYNNNTDLYFVNETAHGALVERDPMFTFALSSTTSDSHDTLNIEVPYSAFDLTVGQPWSTSPTSYFPLRRAKNASQIVLGRAFLQEVYLVVDWERGNFTMGQIEHSPGARDVIPIVPASSESGSGGKGLGIGAIVGIAVGGVSGLLVVGGILGWFCWLKPRREQKRRTAATVQSQAGVYGNYEDEKKQRPEDLDKGDVKELPPDSKGHQRSELESPGYKSEAKLLAEYSGNRHELPSPGEDGAKELAAHSYYELEDPRQTEHLLSKQARPELPGSQPSNELEGQSRQQASGVSSEGAEAEPGGESVQIGTWDRLGWSR